MFKKRTFKKVTDSEQQKRKRKLQNESSSSDSTDSSFDDDDAGPDIKRPALSDPNRNDSSVMKSSTTDGVIDKKTPGENIFKTDTLLTEEHEILKADQNKEVVQVSERDKDGKPIYKGVIKKKDPSQPKPAPTHIRTTTVVDYQPDVCKDFLKNGYCGFGDTCKFLHYRDEFKVNKGSKVKEWEEVMKKNKRY